jgi:hypothetical protein
MRLCITIDVENDGVSVNDERNRLTWSAIELAPMVRAQLARFGMRATWFVRADWQIRALYGRCDFVLQNPLWREFADSGHEIAWHPHLYSRLDGQWIPEYDGVRAAEQFLQVFGELDRTYPVVRIGEAFGAAELTAAMEQLNLRVDSSAIPGRRRDDDSRRFDWSATPNHPYHPSIADFRVPGSPARRLWQAPMTTAPIRAPRESCSVMRYLNLSYRPEVFAAALTDWSPEDTLITILHPDELLPRNEQHPLYAFDATALTRNLQTLAELGAASLTISELADRLDGAAA